MTVSDRIRRYIIEDLGFDGAGSELSNDYPLIESGAIDSMAVFQLVSFLEEEFGIEVEDEDLTPETFSSIDSLKQLVSRPTDQT